MDAYPIPSYASVRRNQARAANLQTFHPLLRNWKGESCSLQLFERSYQKSMIQSPLLHAGCWKSLEAAMGMGQ